MRFHCIHVDPDRSFTVEYHTKPGERGFYGVTPVGHALVLAGLYWSKWSMETKWFFQLHGSRVRHFLSGK